MSITTHIAWYLMSNEKFGGLNYDGYVAYNYVPTHNGRPTYDRMATYSIGSNPYDIYSYN